MNYPTDLPMAEVSDILSIVKSGSITGDAKKFAKDVWVVAGYILSVSLGDNAAKGDIPLSIAITELEASLTADGAKGAIPWSMLLPYIKPVVKKALIMVADLL